YLYTEGMQGGNFSLLEIEECLKNSEIMKKLTAAERGFYFLKGRQEIINIRLERYNIAAQKYKLTLKALKLFKFLPFLKLVAVCNSLSFSNAKQESDIDLFVITTSGRIWVTRLVMIVIITFLGLRPPQTKVQDKICLSFFITDESLDLSGIKIAKDDIYLDFWLATLQPIYQRENFYTKLLEANSWLKKYFPNFLPKELGQRLRVDDTPFSKAIYESKEYLWQGKLGAWLEAKLKKLQLKKMSQKKKDLSVRGDNRVIISDKMLKFHESDRRLEYLEKFEKKREELLK
ncbi:MAG: hypothetical protein NTX82_04600, partial [Candidatus Parcubacteria bacterium]|nr:hypothetical protein [Candidatus Parcubacteria bacterium]